MRQIDDYCNSMNTRAFEVYEQSMHFVISKRSRAEVLKKEMRDRCLEAKREIRLVVQELIDAAFKLSMPQPSVSQSTPLNMITDMRNFKFGMAEDDYEDETHIFQNLTFVPDTTSTQQPSSASTQSSQTMTTIPSTSTADPISDPDRDTVPSQSGTKTPESTIFSGVPLLNMSSSAFFDADYENMRANSGTH